MQGAACAFAVLAYAAAGVHAWRLLPGALGLKTAVILEFPSVYFLAALVLPLQIRPARRMLKRYVWTSFGAGFGQTAVSVLCALGLIAMAAGLIYLQVAGVARGGRYPAGIFSAYAAGAGVLFAQALLVLALEREPQVRAVIEA